MTTESTWIASERYPDPAVRVLDKSFAPYRLVLASVERLATGTRWAEGPVWFGDGRYPLWSEIPEYRITRGWETGATVSSASLHNPRQYARPPGPLATASITARVSAPNSGAITSSAKFVAETHCRRRRGQGRGPIWFSDPQFGFSAITKADCTIRLTMNVYRVAAKRAR